MSYQRRGYAASAAAKANLSYVANFNNSAKSARYQLDPRDFECDFDDSPVHRHASWSAGQNNVPRHNPGASSKFHFNFDDDDEDDSGDNDDDAVAPSTDRTFRSPKAYHRRDQPKHQTSRDTNSPKIRAAFYKDPPPLTKGGCNAPSQTVLDPSEREALLERVRQLSANEAETGAALARSHAENAVLIEEVAHWRAVAREACAARRAAREALSEVSAENARLAAAYSAQRLEISSLRESLISERSQAEGQIAMLQRELLLSRKAQVSLHHEGHVDDNTSMQHNADNNHHNGDDDTNTRTPLRKGNMTYKNGRPPTTPTSAQRWDQERQDLLSLLERLQDQLAHHSTSHQKKRTNEQTRSPDGPHTKPHHFSFSPDAVAGCHRDTSVNFESSFESVEGDEKPSPRVEKQQQKQQQQQQQQEQTPDQQQQQQEQTPDQHQGQRDSVTPQELMGTADRMVRHKKYEEALGLYGQALEATDSLPLIINILCSRASAFAAAGRYIESAADCCRAQKLSQNSRCPRALDLRAEAFSLMQAFDLAVNDLMALSKDQRSPALAARLQDAQRAASDGCPRNYYAILGVKNNATPVDVKSAYKTLALRVHPDKASDVIGHDAATCLFSLLSSAHATLSNNRSRRAYDLELLRYKYNTTSNGGSGGVGHH